MQKSTRTIYSIFSGTIYTIPEKDLNLLINGQIPLSKMPKNNCKKCFGRGNLGRDKNNYQYVICSCIRNVIDLPEATNIFKNSIDISQFTKE
jgi:hypothetical protein